MTSDEVFDEFLMDEEFDLENAPREEYSFRAGWNVGMKRAAILLASEIRPQGEWIRKVDYSDDHETRIHYECDKCGYRPYYKAESDNDACTLNYCGNCGAKMKGE